MQRCFLVSPFCRRRRDCSNSLVPLPRKSGVMIWVHENSVAVRCSLKVKHKCLQKQGSGNWGSVRHEDDLQITVYALMKPNIKPLINRAGPYIRAVYTAPIYEVNWSVNREEEALAVITEIGLAYNWDEFLHLSASSTMEAFTREKLWSPMIKCTS